MVSVAARPGRLLMLLLVSSSFESIPAFAPSVGRLPFEPRTRGAAPPSGAASVVCVFAQPRGTQPCKTKVIVPVTSAEDPRPYGQRIYPVHPDDLSPEASLRATTHRSPRQWARRPGEAPRRPITRR